MSKEAIVLYLNIESPTVPLSPSLCAPGISEGLWLCDLTDWIGWISKMVLVVVVVEVGVVLLSGFFLWKSGKVQWYPQMVYYL